MLKTLMTGEQGGGKKAGEVGSLANIDSNIQGFVSEQRLLLSSAMR